MIRRRRCRWMCYRWMVSLLERRRQGAACEFGVQLKHLLLVPRAGRAEVFVPQHWHRVISRL